MKPVAEKNKRNTPLIFSTLGAVVIFFILCWYAYSYYQQQNNINNIIHIKADTSPIKILPDDPGGMKVEHKDRKIYDRIIGEEEKMPAKVKMIEDADKTSKDEIIKIASKQYKESAEQGAEIKNRYGLDSKNPNAENSDDKLGSLIDDITDEESDKEEIVITPQKSLEEILLEKASENQNPVDSSESAQEVSSAENVDNAAVAEDESPQIISSKFDVDNESSENVKSLSKIQVRQKPEMKVNLKGFDKAKVTIENDAETGKRKTKIQLANVPKSMAGSRVVSSSATVSGYYIQISSHTSRADADDAWTEFKSKFPSFANSSSKSVNEAVVSGKNYFRLSFGPFSSQDAASLKCGALKQKGKDCLVKKY